MLMEAGEIDIEFGDETLFTVDVTGQGKLNLLWNTDFNKEVADLDESANMDFVTFEGNPSFNKNGTVYIYADDDTYLYEVTDGELRPLTLSTTRTTRLGPSRPELWALRYLLTRSSRSRLSPMVMRMLPPAPLRTAARRTPTLVDKS
ncbi:MAG: hypothetical protein V8Q30_08270 [Acutalibacteraceae bacterium]